MFCFFFFLVWRQSLLEIQIIQPNYKWFNNIYTVQYIVIFIIDAVAVFTRKRSFSCHIVHLHERFNVFLHMFIFKNVLCFFIFVKEPHNIYFILKSVYMCSVWLLMENYLLKQRLQFVCTHPLHVPKSPTKEAFHWLVFVYLGIRPGPNLVEKHSLIVFYLLSTNLTLIVLTSPNYQIFLK